VPKRLDEGSSFSGSSRREKVKGGQSWVEGTCAKVRRRKIAGRKDRTLWPRAIRVYRRAASMMDNTTEQNPRKSSEGLLDFDCEDICREEGTAMTAVQSTIRLSLLYTPLFNSLRTVPSISFSMNGFGIMASTQLIPAFSQCMSSASPLATMTGIFGECSLKIRANSQTFI
jgi:hypothetical protein